MDLSQSQDAPRAAPAAEDGAGLPRKLARARMPSPPCARNIFMDGPEDEPNEATQLTRRPPYVSRYRCLPRTIPLLNFLLSSWSVACDCPRTLKNSRCSNGGCMWVPVAHQT